MQACRRVLRQEWNVYRIFGEAALATIGKIYDYNFVSDFLNEHYEFLLGAKSVGQENNRAVFVLEIDNEIVGVMAAAIVGKVCQEIVWYVKPAFRTPARSICLLRKIEEWARQNRANYISISRFKDVKERRSYTPYKELLLRKLNKDKSNV